MIRLGSAGLIEDGTGPGVPRAARELKRCKEDLPDASLFVQAAVEELGAISAVGSSQPWPAQGPVEQTVVSDDTPPSPKGCHAEDVSTRPPHRCAGRVRRWLPEETELRACSRSSWGSRGGRGRGPVCGVLRLRGAPAFVWIVAPFHMAYVA